MNPDITHKISLEVILHGEVIFQSDGHWLFPLFDLEVFLKERSLSVAQGEVRDKVIGKAAALLLLRLRAHCVHGDLMSELAVKVLSQAGISYTYDLLVKRIACQTEEILLGIDDPEVAYGILCKRAKRC